LIASDEARSAKVRRAAIRQQEENILPLGIPDRERPRLGSTRIVAPGRIGDSLWAAAGHHDPRDDKHQHAGLNGPASAQARSLNRDLKFTMPRGYQDTPFRFRRLQRFGFRIC
jgi:hypothetical protein